MSAAIVAAMQAVRQNPTDATVNAQARELRSALEASGVQDRGWEYYLLLNTKKVVTGEDPRALSYVKTNLQRASQVMSRGGMNQALGLVNGANRGVVRDNPLGIKDAQRYMGNLLSKRYAVTENGMSNVLATLRNAGFSQDAMRTGGELYRTFQRTLQPYNDGNAGLQRDLARLEQLVPLAAKQGIIDLPTQRGLLAKVRGWKTEFRVKTPDEVRSQTLQRAQQNAPAFQQASKLLDEAKALRAFIDKKNGWLNTGWGDGTVLKKLVGGLENTNGRLGGAAGELERALALPDSDYSKVDKVKAAAARVDGLIKQLRPKGADPVQYLSEKREAGFQLLSRASTAAELVPGIGKPLAVALKATEAGLRYASGDWSATEAVTKTVLGTFDTALGGKLAGKGSLAAQGVRTFLWKAAQGTAGDVTGILLNPDIPAAKKGQAINAAIASNLGKAFVDAISQVTVGAIRVNSREEAMELYEFFQGAADKLGISQLVQGPLERLKDAWK